MEKPQIFIEIGPLNNEFDTKSQTMQKLANKLSDSNTCTFFDELGNVSEDRAVQKCAKLVDRPKSGRVSIYLQKSGSITAEKEPSEVS